MVAAHEVALRHEPALTAAYERAIKKCASLAAKNFKRLAPVEGADGAWTMPDRDELLPRDAAVLELERATARPRAKMVAALMAPASEVGLSAKQAQAITDSVILELGGAVEEQPSLAAAATAPADELPPYVFAGRIGEMADTTRRDIADSLQASYDGGLSVIDASKALTSKVSELSSSRATMISHTELIGASNAASLGMATASGVATTKTWLATNDSHTRPDHADADGQTVPIADAFDVGGHPMQHPGDQSAPAEEVINCRCTITYGVDDDEAADTAGERAASPFADVETETPTDELATDDETLRPASIDRNFQDKASGRPAVEGYVEQTNEAFAEMRAVGIEPSAMREQPVVEFRGLEGQGQFVPGKFGDKPAIYVSEDYYREAQAKFPDAADAVDADMRGTIHHEYGHALDSEPFEGQELRPGQTVFRSWDAEKLIEERDVALHELDKLLASPSSGAADAAVREGMELARKELLTGGFGSAEKDALVGVMRAINDSRTIEFIRDGERLRDGQLPSKSFRLYLLHPREKFARAFSQWVAEESRDRTLKAAIATDARHWTPDEFIAIREAMSKYVKAAKWIK